MSATQTEITFDIKWSGKQYSVSLPIQSTVLDLKLVMQTETDVPTVRQKLLGLKGKDGNLAPDDTRFEDINLKASTKLMMMGTPESMDIEFTENENIVDDIGSSAPGSSVNLEPKDNPIYLEKIQKRVSSYQFKQLSDPRPGKKLLVLDIDYTIFDHRSTVEKISDLMRPYLHEFLESVYPHYDIMIWSATSLTWIERKMRQLGVIPNSNYQITALVDYGAMITVEHSPYGIFSAKPLKVIWDRFSEHYNSNNTIMFDDLRRNFIMNPQNGLKIEPFKNAPMNREKDDELVWLGQYLLSIAQLEDFSTLRHSKWRDYLAAHPPNS